MGRPLNKKYFGNRNIGTNGREGVVSNTGDWADNEVGTQFPAGDDGIGGKQIRTVYISNSGQYTGYLPSVDSSTPSPSLPGGVQAGNPITYSKAIGIDAIVARGTGYQIGSIITDQNGTTWRVTALTTVSVTKTANGNNYDNDNNIVFDSTGWATGLAMSVDSNSTGALGNFTVTNPGVWDGGVDGDPAPTHLVATMSNTRDGVDQNATGAEFDLVWGIWGLELVESPMFNDDAGITEGTLTTQDDNDGVDATIDVIYTVNHVTFTQPGSGYIGTEDTSLSFTAGNTGPTTAQGILLFAEDTGAVGSATNQENAIIAYAYQDGERRIADIVKQTGSHRYVFITSDNGDKEDEPVKGYLKNGEASATGEADITAYDSDNNEYWVTKITAHKARVWRKSVGDGQFTDGQNVKWTFGDADEDKSVKIQNA